MLSGRGQCSCALTLSRGSHMCMFAFLRAAGPVSLMQGNGDHSLRRLKPTCPNLIITGRRHLTHPYKEPTSFISCEKSEDFKAIYKPNSLQSCRQPPLLILACIYKQTTIIPHWLLIASAKHELKPIKGRAACRAPCLFHLSSWCVCF